MYKRLSICVLFSLFMIVSLYTQTYVPSYKRPTLTDERWKAFEHAQLAYEEGDYAQAILLADTAKIVRKNAVNWSLIALQESLRPTDVQKVGDSIDAVLAKLEERSDIDALKILRNVFNRYPPEIFDNSISNVLDFLKTTVVYPEADFLLGKLYFIEGEYDIAEKYYLDAWKNRAVLDIAAQQYDILYDLAYLAQVTGNEGKKEEYLLLVLASDPVFAQTGLESTLLSSILRSLQSGIGVDKFFQLYRHNADSVLPAYAQLTQYYYDSGRIDKSLPVASLGSLIAFTKIYGALQQKDFEFMYTTFASVLNKMLRYPDVIEWSIEQNVWKLFYLFAQSMYDSGQRAFSIELLSALSMYAPEELWRQKALNTLLRFL